MEYTNPEYEEKQEKMSIADRFITAMLAPRDYGKLLKLSSGSVVGFFALVIFLVSFIQYAIPTLGAVAGLGGVRNIIENQIPQFSLENGTFTLDEKIEQQDNSMGVYIIVDTDKKKFTKDDIPANVVEAIMVSKSNMILYNEVAGVGKFWNIPYDDLEGNVKLVWEKTQRVIREGLQIEKKNGKNCTASC